MMISGIILINKTKDWTSFDVVNKIKAILHEKKVGHLGTLDPMATGVLPISVGYGTRLFDFFLAKNKEYIADFEFGYQTDTLDADGKVEMTTKIIPMLNDIKAAIKDFIGEIQQIPPQFSAKKINGLPAYKYARKGETVNILPKSVTITDIKILEYKNKVLKVKVICSSGTYIRSICRDLAQKLNSLATMTALIRTKSGMFNLEDCITIDKLSKDNYQKYLIFLNEVIDLPVIKLTSFELSSLKNGKQINVTVPDGEYKALIDDKIYGIGTVINEKFRNRVYLYNQ